MVELDGTRFLTIDEVCSRLGVKPATIYAYVSRGVLRSYKQGIKRQRLYREDEVTALLELRPGAGETARPTPAAVHGNSPSVTPIPTAGEHARQPDPGHELLPPASGWIGEL
jgi:excisionase family DNA binding protein